MRKIMGLLVVMCLLVVVVFAANSLSRDVRRAIYKEYSTCRKECYHIKKATYADFYNEYKESYATCRNDYKECIQEAREIKNRTASRLFRKGCREAYSSCRKAARSLRMASRTEILDDYKDCKDGCVERKNYCLNIYEPVCGVDGKTYSNECVSEGDCANEDNCAKEGEAPTHFDLTTGKLVPDGKPCCEGLKAIGPKTPPEAIEKGICMAVAGSLGICSPCGDGVCNPEYEDKCNCRVDCGEE